MKKYLLIVCWCLLGTWLRAVTPVPLTEAVSFSFKFTGAGSGTFTVHGEGGSPYITETSGSSGESTDVGIAWLRPGKKYEVTFDGSGFSEFWLSFTGPTGYALYVTGTPTDLIHENVSTSSFSYDYIIELQPVSVFEAAPFGQFSGIEIGKSITWGVGLGSLSNGKTAGHIIFKERDLSGDVASREKLYYAMPGNYGSVWAIKDGPLTQTLRQVMTPGGLVDLLDDPSGGYWIKFYRWSDVEFSPGNPCILYNSPWKTIRVEASSSYLKITETEGSSVRINLLEHSGASVASGNYQWTLREGGPSAWARTTTHVSESSQLAKATGGAISFDGGDAIHIFNASGTFTPNEPMVVRAFAIGGGGGGGGRNWGSGGGGGGGVVASGTISVSSATSVTIGAGGAAGDGVNRGGDGSPTYFATLTAIGGGGGGSYPYGMTGGSGGSGGGGAGAGFSFGGSGSQGQAGGQGGTAVDYDGGGGGGGAGGMGGSGQGDSHGGGGGAGFGFDTTGTLVYYGGGGGGGYDGPATAASGQGGGGNGATGSSAATAGAPNTGGGGGGGSFFTDGAAGGSGKVVIRYASNVTRQEVITVRTGDDLGTIVAETKLIYAMKAWGEELSSVIKDPDTAALSTTYTYHESPSDRGNYRRVRSVTQPTGNWSAMVYYDDWDKRGQLQYEFGPYNGSPSAVPSSLNPAIGRVSYYEYAQGWTGRHNRKVLRLEKINGSTIVGKSIWSHGDIVGLGWPRESHFVYSYSDSSHYQTSYAESYRGDAGLVDPFLPYAAAGANYAQTAWSYSGGDYDLGTKDFTPTGGRDFWRGLTVNGSSVGSSVDAVSSWDGQDFATTYMVPMKSTIETSIRDSGGKPWRTETWLYLGSGSFTTSPVQWEEYSYDFAGRLTGQVASNGSSSTYHYNAQGLMDYSIDAAGVRTEYTLYDELRRLRTSVKKGVATDGTYAAQVDISTTLTYDALGNVTQTIVTGGTLNLKSTAKFDLAGRQIESVANVGSSHELKTEFDYSAGPKVVKTKYPGGAEKIVEIGLEGQTKSVTGDSVVPSFFEYAFNGSGQLVTTHHPVALASTNQITVTTYDWLGRKVSESVPAWGSGNTIRQWEYNAKGQLAKLLQPGIAAVIYEYDSLGNLFREGLDVGGGGTLTLASTDRITETSRTFTDTGSGNWWILDEQKTYPDPTSGTPKTVSSTYTRISGFSGNLRAEVQTYDLNGNVTTTLTNVNSSTKVLTKETIVPGSTETAYEYARNGLLLWSRNSIGGKYEIGYDNLGRQVTMKEPRHTGLTKTYYIADTNLVDKVTKPFALPGGPEPETPQVTYLYDNAGRVKSSTNALGKSVYYKYNQRGQKEREWGAATYPVEYSYDAFGRQETMKTFRGGTGWDLPTWPGDATIPTAGTADVTTWVFDLRTGLLAHKKDAKNKGNSYTYDSARRVDVQTNARGITITHGYDPATGELTTVTYGDSTPDVIYGYNRMGALAEVQDATQTRSFHYRLTADLQLDYETLGTTSGAFYGDKRITREYETTGTAKGRYKTLKIGTATSPAADISTSYGYDTYGRLNSVAGAYVYTYVGNTQLIDALTASAFNFKREYTYYPYEDWTHTVTNKNTSPSAIYGKFTLTRDALGSIKQSDRTGSLYERYGSTRNQGISLHYDYNDRQELTSETGKVGGDIVVGRDDTYMYDTIGNRSSVTRTRPNGDAGGNLVNTYPTTNELNQYVSRTVPNLFDLTGVSTATAVTVSDGATYSTVQNGDYFFRSHPIRTLGSGVAFKNLTLTTTSPIPTPAFLSSDPENFTYDDDGNLTRDGRWEYQYDAANRLIAMFTRGAPEDPEKLLPANEAIWTALPATSRQKLAFVYDYLGRRVQKTTWTFSEPPEDPEWILRDDVKFVYDGWNVVLEINSAASSIYTKFIWGLDVGSSLTASGGVGALLNVTDVGTNASGIPSYDSNGNVVGLSLTASATINSVSYSAGALVASYEYDAFGRTIFEGGAMAQLNPIQYSSKYTDTETSLVYYGLRYYSPSLGRFINKDPIEESGGLNLYGFVGNNGVNHWDYLGLHERWATEGYIFYAPPPPPFSPRVQLGVSGVINMGIGVSAIIAGSATATGTGGILAIGGGLGAAWGVVQVGMGSTQFLGAISGRGGLNIPGNPADAISQVTGSPLVGATFDVLSMATSGNPRALFIQAPNVVDAIQQLSALKTSADYIQAIIGEVTIEPNSTIFTLPNKSEANNPLPTQSENGGNETVRFNLGGQPQSLSSQFIGAFDMGLAGLRLNLAPAFVGTPGKKGTTDAPAAGAPVRAVNPFPNVGSKPFTGVGTRSIPGGNRSLRGAGATVITDPAIIADILGGLGDPGSAAAQEAMRKAIEDHAL